jgi:Acetoacetate decarboxylase (ADC)
MTTALPYAVSSAAGLTETLLPESLIARLPDPDSVAPAPWETKCHVVSWLHPVGADAVATLPEPIRRDGLSVVAWALVRYDETPVGPYNEIAATLLPDDGVGHIPFIVVDSLPSIVGGRANWLLPKALASFEWSDDYRAVTVNPVEPVTPAWSVSVRIEPTGEATPLSIPSRLQQVGTDGHVGGCEATMDGAMRSATVTVEGHAEGPLAALLKPGTYDATMQTDCTFTCGPLT